MAMGHLNAMEREREEGKNLELKTSAYPVKVAQPYPRAVCLDLNESAKNTGHYPI